MRLIDADAFFEDFPEIRDYEYASQSYEVEAEPVKHGRWEEKTVSNFGTDECEWQSARCSVCGRYHTTPYMYYFTGFKYCPNCEAVMEEQ